MRHYTFDEFVSALRRAGLRRGNIVLTHSNVALFGFSDRGRTEDALFSTVLDAFQTVLGPEGTLVVPTFTYSFGRRQVFDVLQTSSSMGFFAERLRQLPGAHRSHDGMFSVSALGARGEELTRDVSRECFGAGSFWDRFHLAGGIICNMNAFGAASTFAHYVEKCLAVPYRYDKLMRGRIRHEGREHEAEVVFFCQDLSNTDTQTNFDAFNRLAREKELVRAEKVGRGSIHAISAGATFDLITEEVRRHPYFLTQAFNQNKVPALYVDRGETRPSVSLVPDAGMPAIVQALEKIPFDLVSTGMDAALAALATQLPMTIIEVPTGTSVGNQIVPEQWACEEGYLETLGGRRVFSYAESQLHVASYSRAFDGIVARDELMAHLHAPPHSLVYQADWGLCCSRETQRTLTDDSYRVVIKATFSFGRMRLGVVPLNGDSEDCLLLVGSLDHASAQNGGLAGVAAGVEMMRELLRRRPLRYSCRFVVGPTGFAQAADLHTHAEMAPRIKTTIDLSAVGGAAGIDGQESRLALVLEHLRAVLDAWEHGPNVRA